MSADTDLLDEIRDRRVQADAEWGPIKDEAKKDRLCVAGRPWEALDPDAWKERKDAKRPWLALDELGQYLNQTVNDVRANPRGIKFAPTGGGANDEGAEFYQNHTREIEYRSHAPVAYSGAFDNAVTSSYGWVRLKTKRQHIRTFNQDIWIEPVSNPDQVLPGPFVWPDGRDLKYLFYVEPWPHREVEKKFGVTVKGLSAEWRSIASSWLRSDTIDLAEYWSIDTVTRKLVAYARTGEQPTIALVDELPDGKLPEGVENLREEEVEDTKVKAYLTDGIHILDEIKWAGKYIPFVSCLGKVLYVPEGDATRRQILSMTRLARDPYMLYCYIRSCQAEVLGMTPKFPYFYYEGQLSPTQLAALVKSLREPVAAIAVKPTVDGVMPNVVLPPPTRNPYTAEAAVSLDMIGEAARRAIQAAMGISPLPTPMQRQNAKSGRALDRIEASQQKGSFHFVDHYDLMIERTGVLLEDLFTPILDTARDVPVRLPSNNDSKIVRVNDPSDKDSVSTSGDYRVTISTGPDTASQRQAADEFVDTMTSNLPTIAQVAGPQAARKTLAKSIKAKQLGPEMDDLIELIDPPPPNGKDGKPVSPEVAALTQQLQQAHQQLQQASQVIESKQAEKQIELQGQMQIETLKQDKQTAREVMLLEKKLAADIEKTRIAAAKQSADLQAEAREEQIALGRQLVHDTIEATKDRVHDVHMADRSAAHASAATDQNAQIATDQMQQQAALVPSPGDEQ